MTTDAKGATRHPLVQRWLDGDMDVGGTISDLEKECIALRDRLDAPCPEIDEQVCAWQDVHDATNLYHRPVQGVRHRAEAAERQVRTEQGTSARLSGDLLAAQTALAEANASMIRVFNDNSALTVALDAARSERDRAAAEERKLCLKDISDVIVGLEAHKDSAGFVTGMDFNVLEIEALKRAEELIRARAAEKGGSDG